MLKDKTSLKNQSKSISKSDQYVDLKNNGKIFNNWIAHNYKQYVIAPIVRKEGEDPCNVTDGTGLQLKPYQKFVADYMGPTSAYNELLLYHGLGSGKTVTCINLMKVLYEYDNSYNFIILIKASLRDDPWMKDLKVWLKSGENTEFTKLDIFKHMYFVHYDSPYANTDFDNVIKTIDTRRPMLFVIDEAHNFISNVYSNINSNTGKRASSIYNSIVSFKRDIRTTKIVLISGTPGINTPYEFVLMFNMLRPDIFPSSESEFKKIFLTDSIYPILNPETRNLFSRRIEGLVSYYIGATPDLYAKQNVKNIRLTMSEYQYSIYRIFEIKEAESKQKANRYGKQSQLYRTYTRQACNFVFPSVSAVVNGTGRPRPNLYRISEKALKLLETGKFNDIKDYGEREVLNKYQKSIELYLTETEQYFNKISAEDRKSGVTINDDLVEFKNGFKDKYKSKFASFLKLHKNRSKLFDELYDCSPKMLAIVFTSYVSPGKVMVYTNYVTVEGIQVLKIYLRMCGFNDFTIARENMGYCEYHGGFDLQEKSKIKDMYNRNDNVYGNKCKLILVSPSGAEGIQLLNIRQVHILEPYWTEVRMHQVIGRAIRQCSHKQLPMDQRNVTVYRYNVAKPAKLDPDDTVSYTTDEYIGDEAKAKENLLESFLSNMKEAAVDCPLFANINKMTKQYTCFNFPQESLLSNNVGPAYKEDLKDDVKYDSGLHAKNSQVKKVKVIKILAVYPYETEFENSNYSAPTEYWYDTKTGYVYDFTLHYLVGQVTITDGLPDKLDKNTYVISKLIRIPTIIGKSLTP